MTLEIWLWILAGIVVSEIIFIFWMKEQEESYPKDFYESNLEWSLVKVFSFLIGGVIVGIHAMFHFGLADLEPAKNYSWVLIELAIIVGIIILFWINKHIANYIQEKRGDNK